MYLSMYRERALLSSYIRNGETECPDEYMLEMKNYKILGGWMQRKKCSIFLCVENVKINKIQIKCVRYFFVAVASATERDGEHLDRRMTIT